MESFVTTQQEGTHTVVRVLNKGCSHTHITFAYLRLNLDGISLLKKPPPTGPGLGWELASPVGVASK